MRIPLVSAFFPEMTQQIHSLRASGVMSSHTALAALFDSIASRISGGILCVVPVEIFLWDILDGYSLAF